MTLITKPAYWELIAGDGLADDFLSIDAANTATLWADPAGPLAEAIRGARVYSFLGGSPAARKLAKDWINIEPIVDQPPHIVQHILKAAGYPYSNPQPASLRPKIADSPAANAPGSSVRPPPSPDQAADTLWLHPGSGSPKKNAPLSWFHQQTQAWDGPLILSFGEADEALIEPCRQAFSRRQTEFVICPTLPDLRRLLTIRVARYIGNDSGVSHLAAALGIPSTVAFVSTDPAIWRPLGDHVRVIQRTAPT